MVCMWLVVLVDEPKTKMAEREQEREKERGSGEWGQVFITSSFVLMDETLRCVCRDVQLESECLCQAIQHLAFKPDGHDATTLCRVLNGAVFSTRDTFS